MTVVILPTYNERDNLPAMVDALMRLDGLAVLIVDDGSPDGTGRLADELAARADGRVRVLHRQSQRGLGRSYIDGMQEALRAGATCIVRWMPTSRTILASCRDSLRRPGTRTS